MYIYLWGVFKMMKKYRLAEYQKDFLEKTDVENSSRFIVIFIVLMLMSGIQTLVYLFSSNEFYSNELKILKLIIVICGLILIYPINKIRKKDERYLKYSQIIINICIFVMFIIANINTFVAQKVSSDISIYIMMVFIIIAAVRVRPYFMLFQQLFAYIVFSIGILNFQPYVQFRMSHLINGAVINIIAFLLSHMLYSYSASVYLNKKHLDLKNIELKQIAESDSLTDLYNQRGIGNILQEIIKDSKKEQTDIYLGVLDLDNFKNLNDRYGHTFGNKVLRQVADIIKENIRTEDFAGRYGGDEFILIFKDANINQVENIMKRLSQEVKRLDLYDCKLSFSCGLAKWSGESIEKLFERADKYMYQMKHSGRDNTYIETYKTI